MCATSVLAGRADAAGVLLASGSMTPVEQRVAVAMGAGRTTTWTSLRFTSAGGQVGIVVPAPTYAALDIASDAWLEALEVATAPRVLPPAGAAAGCPGEGASGAFHVEGAIGHAESLAPKEVAILANPAAVAGWAADAGLALGPEAKAALASTPGTRFVALRFSAPQGEAITPTLRVVVPAEAPALPLALLHAGAEDLRVTAWMIGQGRADLAGGSEVLLPSLAWNPKLGGSDYGDRRDDVLDGDPARFLVEAAGHAPFVGSSAGGLAIDGVVSTYFERAAAYGDGDEGAAPSCAALAKDVLGWNAPVAHACPSASLGVVDGSKACGEWPLPGQTDPADLRCGMGADDLALALSGLAPAAAWITRASLVIGAGEQGQSFSVDFAAGAPVVPAVVAAGVDSLACEAPFFDGLDDPPTAEPTSAESSVASYSETGGDESSGSRGESCDCDADAAATGIEACGEILGAAAEASDGCATTGSRRSRTPRFSILLFAALTVLVPLRRWGRRRRSVSGGS